MKRLFFFFTLLTVIPKIHSQPSIQWCKTYGGSDFDIAYSVQSTIDGGGIICGITTSNDGDIFGQHGGNDFWVIKVNSIGDIQWKKNLGGTDNDYGRFITQTQDEGYFVVGYSKSNDFDVSGNHGGVKDAWVIKLSSLGAIQWQKCLGGSLWDDAWSAQQTDDNGFIIAGSSKSEDGDLTNNKGLLDVWIIKLDGNGIIEWQKTYGGSKDDVASSIKQTSDGGYIVVGETSSNDGDVSNIKGNVDYWVIKLSDDGTIEWEKTYGGNGADYATDVIQINGEGYVVAGYSGSNMGDVTNNHGIFDYWIIKISEQGELLWEKALGGSQTDYARSFVKTDDGGFIIGGTTQSSDGDVIGNDGGEDVWFVKLNSQGELIWQQSYGGSQPDACYSLSKSNDNGFVVAGYARSTDGDLMGCVNKGLNDLLIMKLSPETSPTKQPNVKPLNISPNPAADFLTIRTNEIGETLQVCIFDLLGRGVLQGELNPENRLDISKLGCGLYLIQALGKDGELYVGKLRKI